MMNSLSSASESQDSLPGIMKPDTFPPVPVLIVDDEEQTLRSASLVLRSTGISNVVALQDSREVLPFLAAREVCVLLMDLSMPHLTGEELLPQVRAEHADIPVIVITGANDLETAVNCMRLGAFDYIVKPVERNRLTSSVMRAIQIRELQRENRLLKQHILSGELNHPEAFQPIVTQNKTMMSIFHYVESIAGTHQPVLVTGETGVGKESMAKAIHDLSGRKGTFVPINVAGLDDTVFSDTLFGHKKGAFTGAQQHRKGLVETAAGGTLFLDEIGDLMMTSQVKLLRLLQEREYYPLGSDVAKRSEARIVVATNQNLEALIVEGKFRKDLYYRLQTHHVHLPALHERKDDLPLLVEHFIEQAAQSLGKTPPSYPKELITLLNTYHFPGNIRELESMVFDAVSKHESKVLSLDVFRARVFRDASQTTFEAALESSETSLITFGERLPTLKQTSELLVEEALRRANGNQSIAARMLGITQQALSKRLKKKSEDDE